MRYLIVNADDYGLTEGVSRGILQAHQVGILTSTTFMVNFPWSESMAALLPEAPDLGVGIHLNITSGGPVLPPAEVPSLVDARGQFGKGMLHLLLQVDLEHLRREWMAQVEKGIGLLGRKPTHLDTHRYLQGHPGYARVMVEIARRYAIPAVRHLYPEMLPKGTFSPFNPVSYLMNHYLRRAAAVVDGSGVAHPDGTLVGDFDLPLLLHRLGQVGEGVTELVSHPGIVDEALRALSSLTTHREVELAALTAGEARQRLADAGIQLVTYAHLSR